MSWYRDWFNSEDYLQVYKHRDIVEAETLVKLIQKNTNLSKSSLVLDMACGSGRHSIVFAQKGFKATAVDLSERLISEAKNNAKQANVDIEFIQSDILDLKLEKKFDLVVNLFTSFGYFDTDEENIIVIKKAKDLLKAGGYFIIDFLNKGFLEKNLIPLSTLSENTTTITQKRSINGNRVEKKITIEKDGIIKHFSESVRLYDIDELNNILQSVGFRLLKTFGDFNGNIFEPNSSPRLIIFTQK
ncbi:MAG: methyltransferase domain-containing protein [Ignavibacteriaceae bacterium]|nr:methyltransferase domain-containing protein [Ignavibacteriaceae bacterium]